MTSSHTWGSSSGPPLASWQPCRSRIFHQNTISAFGCLCDANLTLIRCDLHFGWQIGPLHSYGCQYLFHLGSPFFAPHAPIPIPPQYHHHCDLTLPPFPSLRVISFGVCFSFHSHSQLFLYLTLTAALCEQWFHLYFFFLSSDA